MFRDKSFIQKQPKIVKISWFNILIKKQLIFSAVFRKITESSEEYSRAEVDPSRKVAIREKIRRCLLAMETILNEKLRHSGEITERLETAKHNLQQKWKAIGMHVGKIDINERLFSRRRPFVFWGG